MTINMANSRTTIYCFVCRTILMVKSAKGKTNESFGSESAWEFSARDVSAEDSLSSVWRWKEYNFLPINTKQTKNKNNSWVPVHVQLWRSEPRMKCILTRPCAARSLYTCRRATLHGVLRFILILSSWHIPLCRWSRRVLEPFRHIDP